MRTIQCFFSLLGCSMLLAACACNENNNTKEVIEIEERELTIEQDFTEAETITESRKGVLIQGKGELLIQETGQIEFPDMEILELSYHLPGYYWNKLDCTDYKNELSQIIEAMSFLRNKPAGRAYSMQDGGAVEIKGTIAGEEVKIGLYTHYDEDMVYVKMRSSLLQDNLYNELVLSEELHQLIHNISSWQTFDLKQLYDADAIAVQVVTGYQVNEEKIFLESDEIHYLVQGIVDSAIVTDWSGCPYGIVKMIFYKDGHSLYQAYLSGDGCPEIGIEGQFFEIDESVMQQIYDKIGYEM